VLRYALDLGRVSSVDDVLLNTLGAVLAAQASRPWRRSRSGDDGTVTAPVP
jgi:glycopeptide antibiotics resistance protein